MHSHVPRPGCQILNLFQINDWVFLKVATAVNILDLIFFIYFAESPKICRCDGIRDLKHETFMAILLRLRLLYASSFLRIPLFLLKFPLYDSSFYVFLDPLINSLLFHPIHSRKRQKPFALYWYFIHGLNVFQFIVVDSTYVECRLGAATQSPPSRLWFLNRNASALCWR